MTETNCERCIHFDVCDRASRLLWARLGKEKVCSDFMEAKRWIPVTERLPEEFHSVLICVPTDSPLPVVKEAYLANGCWATRMWGYSQKEVSHWMPLPEPPKEG